MPDSSLTRPSAAQLDAMLVGNSEIGLFQERANDRTHAPQKGLLPQLVDVLHALTGSQQRLIEKLRSTNVECAQVHCAVTATYDTVQQSHPEAGCSSSFAAENATLESQTSTAGVGELDPPPTAPQEAESVYSTSTNGTGPSTWPEPQRRDSRGTEPGVRDYNFFDELDASLADLRHATGSDRD